MIKIPGLETYFGGKGASGTYQAIINQFPPHDSFFSLYLGNCAVTRHKLAAKKINWLMDINPEIVDLWNSINLPDNYNISEGDGIILLESLANEILQSNTTGIVKKNDTVLIYLDPPYLLKTRKSKTRYPYELSEKDHIKILENIKLLPNYYSLGKAIDNNFLVAISHYRNDLYDEYLSSWRRIDFNSMKRGGVEVESLYMNYPEPTELHQYNFLGSDYREREKIQNQIKRNVQRLERMPPILRNAIVTSIKEKF